MDDAELRRRLDAVAHALRPLHRLLVGVVQAAWEKDHGPVAGPLQLYQLVTSEPFFLWLHPMSALMAEIDELVDQKEPVELESVTAARLNVEALITDSGKEHAPDSFVARYLAILQAEPDVVLSHAQLRRVLAQLPTSDSPALN